MMLLIDMTRSLNMFNMLPKTRQRKEFCQPVDFQGLAILLGLSIKMILRLTTSSVDTFCFGEGAIRKLIMRFLLNGLEALTSLFAALEGSSGFCDPVPPLLVGGVDGGAIRQQNTSRYIKIYALILMVLNRPSYQGLQRKSIKYLT